eukprot:m.506018 g.506018  ORF g.506018 m.506018 type:complete len:51 (-) comp21868_c0_seq13:806-958(-)
MFCTTMHRYLNDIKNGSFDKVQWQNSSLSKGNQTLPPMLAKYSRIQRKSR